MSDLRSKLIRLASGMPKGSTNRKALLNLLADEADVNWNTVLRTRRIVEEEGLDKVDDFSRQLTILKSLRPGDRVKITYDDPQRGGEVSTLRDVSWGWEGLKEKHPGRFNHPQVLLEPFRGVGDATKGGTIKDLFGRRRLMWQPTMRGEFRPVVGLVKR